MNSSKLKRNGLNKKVKIRRTENGEYPVLRGEPHVNFKDRVGCLGFGNSVVENSSLIGRIVGMARNWISGILWIDYKTNELSSEQSAEIDEIDSEVIEMTESEVLKSLEENDPTLVYSCVRIQYDHKNKVVKEEPIHVTYYRANPSNTKDSVHVYVCQPNTEVWKKMSKKLQGIPYSRGAQIIEDDFDRMPDKGKCF